MPSGDGMHTAGASFALRQREPLPYDASDALRLVSDRVIDLAHDVGEEFTWLAGRLQWLHGFIHGKQPGKPHKRCTW